MAKFVILPAFIIIFVFSNMSGSSSVTRADVATFYPETCLGGFEYPENAAGEFSLIDDSVTETFNRNNSAYIKDRSASIYCGGFEGEIPEDTEAKEFVLTFSWLVEGGGAYEYDNFESADSLEESRDEESNMIEETSVDKETKEEELAIPEDVTDGAEEEPQEVEDSPKEEPAPEVSFWNLIFGKYAFAEEEVDSMVEEELSDNEEEVKEEEPVFSENISEDEPDGEVQGIFDSKNTDSVDETEPVIDVGSENEESAIPEDVTMVPSDAFLEVSYTTDGIMWHVLGLVGRSNWKDTSFEIPLHGWEDMENVQIGLKTLMSFDETPKVYLDGIKLSVQYEKMSPEEILSPDGNLTVFDPSKGFYILNISANEIPDNMPVVENPTITTLDVISFFDRNSPNDTTGIYIFRESDEALLVKEFVGKGNETTYSVDSLGDGILTVISTKEPEDCEDMTLSECRMSDGFIKENSFTVLPNEEAAPINIVPEEKSEKEIFENEEKEDAPDPNEEVVDDESVEEPVSDMIDSDDVSSEEVDAI